MTPLTIVESPRQRARTLAEQADDHHRILSGYIDTYDARGYAVGSRANDAAFLRKWFTSQGESMGRPLFVWEAMQPIVGHERILAFAKDRAGKVAVSTLRTDLGRLRRLFEYVLAWSYVPGSSGASVPDRYGPIEQPVLEYDYPLHSSGGRKEDMPLVRHELKAFYKSLHASVEARPSRDHVPARTYTMCVLAGEAGLRISEICALEVDRDLLFAANRVQTRNGKASRGSGPRVRQTIFTPLAQATMRHYLEHVRTRFRRWSVSPFVFLSERGEPLAPGSAYQSLCRAIPVARNAGVRIPPRFGWHSLRRSFATIFLEEHPGALQTLMEMLGHDNPGSLSCYIKHTRSYHEKIMDQALSTMSK